MLQEKMSKETTKAVMILTENKIKGSIAKLSKAAEVCDPTLAGAAVANLIQV